MFWFPQENKIEPHEPTYESLTCALLSTIYILNTKGIDVPMGQEKYEHSKFLCLNFYEFKL